MSISQSRANSRGPLIAVIKIEIQDDQVDRIFLHQNDDDFRLAEQFQLKHRLNPAFVQHIYNKIKMSRESLLKQITNIKSPQPHFSSRSSNIFTNSNYTPNPVEQGRENTYRNQDSSLLSPFERIPRYTPIKQQNTSQIKNPKVSDNIQSQQNLQQTYPNSVQYNNLQSKQSNSEVIRNKDNQNSTFETFMNSGKNIKSNNQELFQKYMRERKQQNSKQKTQKLITKDNGREQNFSYQSIQTIPTKIYKNVLSNQKSKAIRSQSSQKVKNYTDSHYSFNDDKPERVKILKRDQIQSMQSMQSSKKSLSKYEKQKIAKDVTSRLYNQSDIKKSYLNKIKQRAKQQKQEKQDKQLTHRPQINKLSQLIATDRYKNVAIQDYLIDKAKRSQVKKQAERAIKAQKQMENCSFKPQVNIISQKLVRNHSKSQLKDSHNHNKTLDQCSRNHCHSQLAFRPSLNKMSEQIVRQKGQGNFQQRLKGFLQQKNNKLNELTKQKKVRQKIDEKGQQLFRPRTYSKPQNRSPKGSQVHDYLYELSKLQKSHRLEEQKPTINENSEQIIQQMYTKRIAWLFSELDSDQDGFISPKRICIDTISEDVLEVIIPVLFEMEQMDIELNLADFRNAIKNLHPSLNAHQKSILYNYSTKANIGKP